MESLWNASEASAAGTDALDLRVYTSRLLGRNPDLVLHGGGNTSVKESGKDFFGDPVELIYVKGSGWDLATIERGGFAPVRMEPLLRLGELAELSDGEMVRQQRVAMIDPGAPNPSIEAILHAILPFRYVDHTHADAVVALTNHPEGEARVREVYGKRVLVVPYVMPGFILAKTVADLIRGRDLRGEGIEGLILLNHGIFTFHDEAKASYELMIELVTMAEEYLAGKVSGASLPVAEGVRDLVGLSRLRGEVAKLRGGAVIARLDDSGEAVGFSLRGDVGEVATRGPLTPDHSIRTKRIPAVVGEDIAGDVAAYSAGYREYFERNAREGDVMLDTAPRIAVWKGRGVVSFGATEKEAEIVFDIAGHTYRTVALAEAAGGWKALPEEAIYAVEYWDLEQAKLKGGGAVPPHRGKVAVVTGSAAGIGFACAEALAEDGAKVIGLDLNPEIVEVMAKIGGVGMVVNLTDDGSVADAIGATVARYGGIDIVVSNAGIFTAGAYLEELEQSNWDKSMAVNLTSHQKLLKYVIPYLKNGYEPAIVLVGSRNVNAPGAGAASYSCAKAGLTQLCRVAALELAPVGVRCNIIHPDAVFDTKLWTPEALQRSAERYGLTVEEYKTRNLLKTEIRSKDVGRMVAAMAGRIFGKTTGAQIPVDGGNDRVI